MLKKYQMNEEEEEKVGYSDTKIVCKTKNYLLYDKNKSFEEKEDNPNLFKNNQIFTEINNSTKCLRNNYEKFKLGILDTNSRDLFIQKNEDNKSAINNDKNKRIKYEHEVLLDKEELFIAFKFFQQLLQKGENQNKSEDNIKNKLFDFVLKRKSIKNQVKNNNKIKRDENIFNTYNCHHLNIKLYDFYTYKNSNKKIIKSFSYSFINNHKQNIFDNFYNLSKENIRDTPKSASQLFDEILLSALSTCFVFTPSKT